MAEYTPQVSRDHYTGGAYRFQDRWNSYWHQLLLVRTQKPKTVLEVGVGEGVVARELRNGGISVTTLDIAEDLQPDVIGSVTDIPCADASFDMVLAAEILEHISFDDVPKALQELRRIATSHVLISLPHPGYVFSLVTKLPLLPQISFLFQIPFFWKDHVFNGEHYWELGKRGYPVSRFVAEAKAAGLTLVKMHSYADDPGHRFFVFSIH
jgi:SAM-dependent methyltransferase